MIRILVGPTAPILSGGTQHESYCVGPTKFVEMTCGSEGTPGAAPVLLCGCVATEAGAPLWACPSTILDVLGDAGSCGKFFVNLWNGIVFLDAFPLCGALACGRAIIWAAENVPPSTTCPTLPGTPPAWSRGD